ncbi:S-layer homology domain-containing protein [Paenibacillus arenilitoris]|uniref:S-layer homology domain-containing protein n=1 Tax=Paenibacillus arenilitoris TaxID=2772299 RepID=A0A927CKB3_9BACL|nr:S-layer homology domain-containing protein [Paenibacillus arenilitoris]MBD2868312.1 S-layer homology domain-containing protein [Paenibacillus arenilitoris]
MRKKNRNKLAVMLSAAMLMSALPGTAFAESATNPAQAASDAAGGASSSSEGSAGQIETEAPVDVAITKEKAEALARQYVSIPKEYTLQGASFSMDVLAGGKRNAWGLDFVKKANGKHVGSIYVRIHADSGQLLEFSSYTNNPSAKPTYPLKVERDTAQEIALKFIAAVAAKYEDQIQYNPDYGAQLLPPLTGAVTHHIRFDRIVGDIPYVDNYIELQVDSEGHITSFSLQWDDTAVFPKVDTKLTPEEAGAKLREAASPQLSYIVPHNPQGVRKPMLSYDLQAIAIDAVTGELKGSNEHYYRAGTVSETPVSEKPLGEAPKAGTVTEKQAVDAVKAAFKLPGDAELSSSNYSEQHNEGTGTNEAYWHLGWTIKKDGKETGSAHASVDGRTGAVRSYYIYYHSEQAGGNQSVTLEQATTLAVEAVKKHLPWLAHELYLVKPHPDQYKDIQPGEHTQYYLSFVHKVHGATAEYDNVGVAIDSRTGDVVNFDANISSFAYPAEAPALISKDAAVDKWMDYYRTQLTYRLVQQFTWNGQPIPIEKYKVMLAAGEIDANEVKTSTEAELVYRLVPKLVEESVFLDAQSGDWRNRETGEATQLEKPQAADIEGHWAQRQLELMVAYKALDVKDGKVRPNELVTRGELIKMLVLARNAGRSPILYGAADGAEGKASFDDVASNSSYFVYVESALEQNLIDIGDGSFNPEGKVTRDEMAELIVRALGYNALANYDYIFQSNFKDAAQIANKGQAAIAVGLKIMSLSDGKFLPKKQVTRAEASVAFFRYLQSRADLQEAPIRM